MHSETEMNWQQVHELADRLILEHFGRHSSDIEVQVLQGSWLGKSYEQIAEESHRSLSYISRDVGNKLWKKLSVAFGEEITKSNFRQAFKRAIAHQETTSTLTDCAMALGFPEGPVPLDSPFYVERPPIESDCYIEMLKPGALISIRGARQMGKTSLLNRMLNHAALQNYRIVRLNLRKAEKTTLSDLNRFLRWLCLNITRQLDLEPQIDDYWDEEIGCKVSCTGYLESYLLKQIETNLVIGLDEIDTVFPYSDIAEDFLSLLREWYEESVINENWQKLRFVIAHSTEVYLSLNIHQSPFNIGLPVKLKPFDQLHIETLARSHNLAWTGEETKQLNQMIGGHPYLVRLALFHLARHEISLSKLLQDAPTNAGIYSGHLRRCLGQLKQQPELLSVLKKIVLAPSQIQIESFPVYQLDSMGLVQLDGNHVAPSCELYRQYFNANI